MKKTLEQEVASLRRDLKAISAQLADGFGQTVDEAGEKAEEYMDEFADTARTKWEAAKEYGRKGREYIEDHPWQAIGAGLAVGLLIGFMARRRD